MNRLLSVSLIALTLAAGVSPKVVAQSPALQKGISVELASTSNATPMRDADNADAWIVTVTENGSVYFGTDPVTPAALADEMKSRPRDRQQKFYIKADARAPFANVQRVLEAARETFFEAPVLLTSQPEASTSAPETVTPPEGLEVWVGAPPSGSQSIMVQALNAGQQSPILKVDREPVSSEALRSILTQASQNRSGKVIRLNADGQLSFAQVVRVIDTCRSVGAKVVLVTSGM
jgi:biopolymer transport protein ExbD